MSHGRLVERVGAALGVAGGRVGGGGGGGGGGAAAALPRRLALFAAAAAVAVALPGLGATATSAGRRLGQRLPGAGGGRFLGAAGRRRRRRRRRVAVLRVVVLFANEKRFLITCYFSISLVDLDEDDLVWLCCKYLKDEWFHRKKKPELNNEKKNKVRIVFPLFCIYACRNRKAA